MNGKKPSRTEQKLPDEALGALASQYVEAMEPSAGGEPKRREAGEIARRIRGGPSHLTVSAWPLIVAWRQRGRQRNCCRRVEGLRARSKRRCDPHLRRSSSGNRRCNRAAIGREDPLPRKVIWRTGGEGGRVLARGQCAILAGAGKAGKSWLAVSLAIAAAQARREQWAEGQACGLAVVPGRVLILSYEDSPKEIDLRAEAAGAEPGDVLVLPEPPPVYGYWRDEMSGDRGARWQPLPEWRELWDAIRDAAPQLVIVDTGPKCMGGETTDPGAVIGFLQAVEREARKGAFGVLVLAHDTKAARDAAKSGAELDAGAVAGSGQWHDAPRGVLHLTKTGPGDANRLLECVKASYAEDGWGARLRVRREDGRYAGLELDERLDEAGMAEARRELRIERQAAAQKETKAVKSRVAELTSGGGTGGRAGQPRKQRVYDPENFMGADGDG